MKTVYILSFPIIVILVCIFLLLAYTVFYYPITNFENFNNTNLYNTSHFNKYINSVHKDMQYIKLNSNSTNFKNEYKKRLIPVPNKYNTLLNKYTAICDLRVKKYSIFKKYKWKFIMSTNYLEKGMPYTIHDTIILPHNLLENIYNQSKNNRISNSFINTLIHEKIHIIQRFNQNRFNTFYKTNYKFAKGIYNNSYNEINRNYMNNPDSNNSLWIYNFNNKNYVVYLGHKNGRLRSIGKPIGGGKELDLDKIKLNLGYSNSISFYHPNEIFACHLTEQILHNNVKPEYNRFLSMINF